MSSPSYSHLLCKTRGASTSPSHPKPTHSLPLIAPNLSNELLAGDVYCRHSLSLPSCPGRWDGEGGQRGDLPLLLPAPALDPSSDVMKDDGKSTSATTHPHCPSQVLRDMSGCPRRAHEAWPGLGGGVFSCLWLCSQSPSQWPPLKKAATPARLPGLWVPSREACFQQVVLNPHSCHRTPKASLEPRGPTPAPVLLAGREAGGQGKEERWLSARIWRWPEGAAGQWVGRDISHLELP